MSDVPVITPANLCAKHQWLLLHQAGIPESGPWRVAVVMAQIALFQCATCDEGAQKRLEGDITRIAELGCLACFRPDAFGEVVAAAETGDLGSIKLVGERWIERSKKA